ncbi:hypothetical protein NL108_009970 [Boleophthalmus pectinirostris]|uniref:erythroblast NAD(P)(+)--arginine ADP-ribosyltransferase-like n=1 Tax=Boleophthalmus pectinirostris TaxID=150288 RepID=UPI00242AF260|nr:erythroblast NAD(P)(+)--arginine ADP-ribosyltransferase-like [Boleophthalmus pectinirostris]KAJ0055714.1 hypothetical protein NL108_009970 [Boleophthalmus pectinirostris]
MLNFVLCLTLSIAYAKEPPQLGTIELSMMNQSIDDMFSNCIDKMATQVQEVYFPREIQISPFRDAWKKATSCALKKLETLQTKSKELTINHTKALCIYTLESPKVYEQLNTALRTGAPNYNTTAFQYHALYFWITSALQIMNSCQTTYRRTKNVYNGIVNTTMRFGNLASSSLRPNMNDIIFGSVTCFHIKTCLGAYIGNFSTYPSEEEVLIPPYETFKIIKIVATSYGALKCNKIFVLESVGHKSNLNCKAVSHNQGTRANIPLILGFQLLIGLIWNHFHLI